MGEGSAGGGGEGRENGRLPARGLLSILNEPHVALRDSAVGSCWPAIVITRCREHTRPGEGEGGGGGGRWRRAMKRAGPTAASRRRSKTTRAPGHALRLRTVIDAD